MTPTIITWGFDSTTGEIYLDCFLKIQDCKEDATALKMINLRCQHQGTKMALIKIPSDQDREYVESYIEDNPREDTLKFLNKAQILPSHLQIVLLLL